MNTLKKFATATLVSALGTLIIKEPQERADHVDIVAEQDISQGWAGQPMYNIQYRSYSPSSQVIGFPTAGILIKREDHQV